MASFSSGRTDWRFHPIPPDSALGLHSHSFAFRMAGLTQPKQFAERWMRSATLNAKFGSFERKVVLLNDGKFMRQYRSLGGRTSQ